MEADGDCLKSRAEFKENSLTENCTNVLCEESCVAEGEEGDVVQNRAEISSDKEKTADVNVDEADKNVTAKEQTESSQSDDEDNDEDDQIQENEIQETAVVEQDRSEQQPQQHQQEYVGIWGMIKALVIRMIIIYIISTLMRRGRLPPTDQVEKDDIPVPVLITSKSSNLFPKDMLMDMFVYVTESKSLVESDGGFLFWFEKELKYGDWTSGQNGDGTLKKTGQIEISEAVIVNGSLFIHVYFVKTGLLPNFTADDALVVEDAVYGRQCLTRIHRQQSKTNIINKNEDNGNEDNGNTAQLPGGEEDILVPYWNPNLIIGLITDHSQWSPGSVPSPLSNYIRFVPDQPYYYPLVYFNSYWNLDREYMPINSTTRTLNLTLIYSPLSLFRWTVYPVQTMSSQVCPVIERSMKKMGDSQDFIKMAFLDNGLFLLIVVSFFPVVHALVSFLVLRNEISFWSNLRSLEGISVCCALVELFHSIVAVLYVMEVQTAFIFTLTAFVGLAVAIWKSTKIFDTKLNYENRILGIIPQLECVYKESYFNSPTRQYDMVAFKHVSLVLGPVLAVYAGYASVYNQHQYWYTWTISMLYGFLTTFGVLLMMPQIFINYKLKSVDHLPWRSMIYRAVDAFLDSAFAFVIQAPSYYRIGFFRYDIVFYICLYQYWIYRPVLQQPPPQSPPQ